MACPPARHCPGPAPATPAGRSHARRIRLEISYFAHGQWLASWGADQLPDLVRIRIFPADEPDRHWPDIVISPMRARHD